ncbi:MAG TPA: hypothetical protein VFK27_02965 [Bacillales bacterium]|nr:hypothetical protein [Bacillales bacterium]
MARTHAFKVPALARKQAYSFVNTPSAKKRKVNYYDALEIIENELSRMHSKIKAKKRY